MCVVQERNQLSIQLTNLQVDFDNVNARLEEETENATSLRSQLQKAVADYQTLKSRFDKELLAKTEELEEIRSAARDWVLVCGRSGGGSRKVWAKRPSGSWGRALGQGRGAMLQKLNISAVWKDCSCARMSIGTSRRW